MAPHIAQPAPPNPPLPPLLALPPELKHLILTHISRTDPHHAIFTLITLRRTHPSFRTLIPRTHHFSSHPPALKTELLSLLEHKFPHLIPQDHSPCHRCRQVLHTSHFGEDDAFWGELRPAGGEMPSGRTCGACWDALRADRAAYFSPRLDCEQTELLMPAAPR